MSSRAECPHREPWILCLYSPHSYPCHATKHYRRGSSAPCEEGDDEEGGEEVLPSCMDYVMHFITVFWKVLFAFVPPTAGRTLVSSSGRTKDDSASPSGLSHMPPPQIMPTDGSLSGFRYFSLVLSPPVLVTSPPTSAALSALRIV
ncbi:Sodium/calcium exchanger 2 [Portunus trituberculatus]|uniref:Sodium/calcium exchanger 2 n=1 Tax=Portunus trituberculatus TaxID=210409 RepID=A0A5B7D3G7_PORTR|nr:Sodium/calcium exchanger 2 [Portunus trituberculatus]